MKSFLILVLVALLYSCNQKKNSFKIHSPNQKVSVLMENVEGKIKYSVLWKDKTLVSPSELSIFAGSPIKITTSHQRTENSKWNPTWGQFIEIHGKTNPEAYQIRTGTVKQGDVVKAKIAPGGGHCMWIKQK